MSDRLPRGHAKTCIWWSGGRGRALTRSPTRSRSTIRRCGQRPGPPSRTSPGRAISRTEYTPSRAASKAISVFRDCCMDGGSKSLPLRKDGGPTRERGIASKVSSLRRTRWAATEGGGRAIGDGHARMSRPSGRASGYTLGGLRNPPSSPRESGRIARYFPRRFPLASAAGYGRSAASPTRAH